MKFGLPDAFAAVIAFEMASISLPSSTKNVANPCASKRALTFSVKAISVFPSIVILFESYNTINLSRPNDHASDAAS